MTAQPRRQDDDQRRAATTLATVNDAHGTSFRLIGRLAGGYQTGAYRLEDEAGGSFVLKWGTAPRSIERMAEAAATVAAARDAGWPTPAWVYWGVGPDGYPYEVQEFVDGTHRSHLDEETLDLLLEVNGRQANLDLPTGHNWSVWARAVVFGDTEGRLSRIAAASPEGRRFSDAVQRIANQAGSVELVDSDLVCGVFALENILFQDDSVAGVIDVEAMGKGSRAHDLAVLYSIEALWGTSPGLLGRLRRAAEALAGAEAFAVFLATEFVGLLDFGLSHWETGIASTCQTAAACLEALARA